MDRHEPRLGCVAELVERLAISRSGGYTACLLQLVVTLLLVSKWPRISIDVMMVRPHVAFDHTLNQTMVSSTKIADTDVWHNVSMAPLSVAVSACVAVFGLLTMQISERRENMTLSDDTMHVPGYAEFTSDNEDLMSNGAYNVWNVVFSVLIFLFHCLVACVVCTPTTVECILLSTLSVSIPLLASCKPRMSSFASSRMRNPPSAFTSSQMTLLIYVSALTITASRISYDPFSYRIQLLGTVALVDCFFLMLGHSWDSNPVMETIYNCRVSYACVVSIIHMLVLLYWVPLLATRYTKEV